MAQEQIIEFLRENPGRWHEARGISNKIGIGNSTINHALKRLREREEILSQKLVKRKGSGAYYTYKHKDGAVPLK